MSFYTQYPLAGVPIYASSAAFPASATNGSLAVAADTDTLYVFTGSVWAPIGAPSVALAVGALDAQVANANGLSLVLGTLTQQSANVTYPGLVNNTTQSFSGAKTFTGAIVASNLSGTNTGDVTLTAVGAIPNANGASLVGQALTLQPANTSFPGVLTAADWNTFNSKQAAGNYITALTGDVTATGPGSVASTLATVNSNVGTFGTATQTSTVTINAKGLVTAASNTAIQIAEAQVTNLVSDLAGKQPVGNYITALTGDATASGPGSAALTLATVNSNVGSFGTASQTSSVTVNAKGLVTAASNTAIQIAESQVTNLVSDLAGKAAIVLPVTNQMVYVNYLLGNDGTGDGSYSKPYKTVAFAMTTISDASSTKPYVVALQAERQIETTDVFMKPYTFIVGQMQRATYMRINGGSLKPDPSHATANSWVGLNNLYWGGSSTINWDLQALGGQNCVFVIQNCTVTGTFTYKGRNAGGGDYLENYTGVMFGPITLDSVNAQMQSLEMIGTTTVTDTQAGGTSSSFNNTIFDANVSITAGGTYNLRNCTYESGVTLTTSGTLTLSSYRGLPIKANRTFSGGTTVTNLDNATIVPYTPATSSNYNAVPTDASGALDTLAVSGVAKSQTQNLVLASPNGSSGLPTFRALVAGDLPSSSAITALTGDVVATGPGSVAATIQPLAVTNAKIANSTIDLTTKVTGVLPVANGGTGNSTAFTPGSVLYADGSGNVSQDSSNFFWDATNKRLSLQGHLSTAALGLVATGSEVGMSISSTASNTALDVANQGAQFVAQFTNSTNSATQGAAFGGAFSRGTIAARTAVQAGDQVATWSGQSYNGASFGPGYNAALAIIATQNQTSSANGGQLTIATTPNGSLAPVAGLTVNQDQTIQMPHYTTNGFVKFSGANGTLAVDTTAYGTGTVTSASVVSANGFAGTVATATTTPALTLTTTITGVLKGNGTAISAATAGTDYSAGTSALATGILKSTTTTGALTIAVAGDFPTLNQNTTGSAATLTTARTINGVSFDGSANITVTAAAGTLTGTTLNSSVVSSSLTSVGTITSGTWNGTTVAIANGGTGQTTKAAAFDALSPMTTGGDIIYGGTSGTGTRLANGTSGQFLRSNGTTTAPSWASPTISLTAPTIQKFTSGSGTYTTAANVLYIQVELIGAGGGGGGGGTTDGTAAAAGGASTFGSSLLSAGGGAGGARAALGGAGGTSSLGSGPVGLALSGGMGGSSTGYSGLFNSTLLVGGQGGNGAYGGGGGGAVGFVSLNASAGTANTGGGGGGGTTDSANNGDTGSGGGSGGYIKAIITSPSATYAYAVGSGGSGQGAGTSGGAGGAGGSGFVLITEYYQ